MSTTTKPPVMRRGLCFDLGAKPQGLFVPGEGIKEKVWDPFAPVWGPVVKFGVSSQFDEMTYAQMLDDALARNLCIYMDEDHATAAAGFALEHVKIPSLAYYCGLEVHHEGKLWRSVQLAGHDCARAVKLDTAATPEGLFGFRCTVTPMGRLVLPNYQAMSIHFDPNGDDWRGHPVGQVLICVSAVNGPHIPMATPRGGAFSQVPRAPAHNERVKMKKKFWLFAKDDGSDMDGGMDMSATMAHLAQMLGMPEGAEPEAVLGACIAALKASGMGMGEPDGDEMKMMEGEGMDGEMKMMGDAMAPEMKAMSEMMDPMRMPGMGKMGADGMKCARVAALRFSKARRAMVVLARELGADAGKPVSVVKALLAYKAKSTDAGEFAKVSQRLAALEQERVAEKAADKERAETARKGAVETMLARASTPTNACTPAGEQGLGLISKAKADELRGQAAKYSATPDDVRSWLPSEASTVFSAGGTPSGKPARPAAGGEGGDRMVGAEHADRVAAFRDAYQKETGKRVLYSMAGQIIAEQKGEYVYQRAKERADRLPAEAFVKKGGK